MTTFLNKDDSSLIGKKELEETTVFYNARSKYKHMLIKIEREKVPEFKDRLRKMPFNVEIIVDKNS